MPQKLTYEQQREREKKRKERAEKRPRMDAEEAQMRKEKEQGVRAAPGSLTPEQVANRCVIRNKWRRRRLSEQRRAQCQEKKKTRMGLTSTSTMPRKLTYEQQREKEKKWKERAEKRRRWDAEEARMRKEKEQGVRAARGSLTPEQVTIRIGIRAKWHMRRLRAQRRAQYQAKKEIGMGMTSTPITPEERADSIQEPESASSPQHAPGDSSAGAQLASMKIDFILN
ncbi:hypothetical protein MMC07_009703 [Pseudocyphellaria aurata]|nr:hypothetical protein [Pseudocyphellaria aurata]